MNNPRLPFDEARPLSAAARTLYDHLCWLGEPAVSSLTNNTMGAAIGRSERTVIQALNELAAADLIVREYRAPDRTNPATASGRVIRLRRAPAA
ncbi:MAG: helix-turn-helix domain-containing protein [Candidatus Dormibacteraeota bacterium]|nr:helix-turn-helix domain-containing protein [Candidatus Dormibacteraeota bacterium]